MPRQGYLYRRPSGIYVVRICVPKRHRQVVGRGEIHVSTGAREIGTAKARAFDVLLTWQQRLLRFDGMDVIKVADGSPLLLGAGFVRVADAARAIGLAPETMLQEVANDGAALWCHADHWSGWRVDDLDSVDRDHDGSYILNSAFSIGHEVRFSGALRISDTRGAVASLRGDGVYEDCLFFLDGEGQRAIFFDLPGQCVPLPSVLIDKPAAEKIRFRLASAVSPEMLESAKQQRIATSAAVNGGHKYASMKVSELTDKFLADKHESWKDEQRKKMRGMCGTFAALMDDPCLGDIDGPLIKEYRTRLQALPHNLYQIRRRYSVDSISELIAVAEKEDLPRMSLDTARAYVRRLSELFVWAMTDGNDYLPKNPAVGVGAVKDRDTREQDARCLFDRADLAKIFGFDWFQVGRGQKTAAGTYREFQPHYYWLPLLGLYSGGRINELSQLYVRDIKQDALGCWHLDFNLVGADKVDADDKKEIGSDKSLKTVNSIRVVPLHNAVLRSGFLEYVQALKEAGHARLFPELNHNKTKGYGKAASSWFNERFLGRRLRIVRDGTKTFHSFRHTFITALFDAEIPEVTVAQIAGHQRGKTESAKRYRKDQEATRLMGYVERVRFDPPPIASFDVAAGLNALADALARKKATR